MCPIAFNINYAHVGNSAADVNEKCEPPFFHSVSWAGKCAKKWRLVFVLDFFISFFIKEKIKRIDKFEDLFYL